MKPLVLAVLLLAGCAAPALPPRGFPDSAWYPAPPAPVEPANPYASQPAVRSEPVEPTKPEVDYGPRTCEEKYASEIERAKSAYADAVARQPEIDAACKETVHRNVQIWEDGRKAYYGPARKAWICNGVPVDFKPTPNDGNLRRLQRKLQECLDTNEICKPPYVYDQNNIKRIKPACVDK